MSDVMIRVGPGAPRERCEVSTPDGTITIVSDPTVEPGTLRFETSWIELDRQRHQAMENIEAGAAWRAAGCPAGEILHPRDLYALRKRVAELDLCREVLERMLAGESFVGDGLREMLEQIETPADRHRRFEQLRDQLLAANICLACGAHTPGRSCQCENDE